MTHTVPTLERPAPFRRPPEPAQPIVADEPALGSVPAPRSLHVVASLPTGADKRAAVQAMFDRIAPRYQQLNRLLTFHLDGSWRRRALDALDLAPGQLVLDLATGPGDLLPGLAARHVTALGVDLSSGMLRLAPPGALVVQGDAAALPLPSGRLDGAVSAFALRNFVELGPVLAELARVLRPGGRIALLDVSTPRQVLLAAGHALWFGRAVPAIGGLLSDGAAYRYLPKSLAYLPEPPELVDLVRRAGFVAVEHRLLSGGIVQLLSGTRAAMATGRAGG